MKHEEIARTCRTHPAKVSVSRGRLWYRRVLAWAFLAGSPWLLTANLPADTIFLKDGSQIIDCQVVKETESIVFVRTKVGDMGVPRSEIYRIIRQKSAYDLYQEQLSRLREGDVNGHYKLALWCRKAQDLRSESDQLLTKVLSIKENHLGARRLLGHLKIEGEWIVPEPLAIRLRATGGDAKADLLSKLELFLKTRQDLRIASETDSSTGAAAGGEGTQDPLAACTLDVSVTVARKTGSKLYGLTIGRPSLVASVCLEAESPWIGRKHPKVSVSGEVMATQGKAMTALAIQNALGSNSKTLHRFLDNLTQTRSRLLKKELQRKKAEEKAEAKARKKVGR